MPPLAPTAATGPRGDADAPEVPRRRWRWRYVLGGLALLFVLLFAWLAWTAPLGRALEPLESPALVLLDAEGKPFARRGDFKEPPVSIDELPPHVVDALLSTEDRRFYSHWGVDPQGLARAFMTNMQAGGVVQGGSTITQQLAKTSFLSSKRSYKRKAQELLIAFWLEAWLSKDEILSRYLSSVYFGEGAWGLRAASRTYFNREPKDLTLAEAAMLAGIIKAPSALAPSRHLLRAQKRSVEVLRNMVENSRLSPLAAVRVVPAIYVPGRSRVPVGSYFGDWVLPQAREALGGGQFGEVRVRTTLDPDLQKAAETVIGDALRGSGPWMGVSQAALVAMRPTGEVVAMVGGDDYTKNPFNRVSQAKRQPGSSFKLFVYLAALRNGFTPESTVDDTPVNIDGWQPRNDEGKYRGTGITLRRAIAASSNVAAARLTQTVGTREVIRVARDLGVKSYLTPWPALSLGTSRMTLLELTSAYAAVSAGRYPVRPVGLSPAQPAVREWLVETSSGTRAMPEAEPMRVLLETAVRAGTGNSARLPIKAYGKTGTTQNFRDALFVGFAGDLVVGVWVGNDDNRPMNGVTGRTLPAQIWRRFMMQALPELKNTEPPITDPTGLEDFVLDEEGLDALGEIGTEVGELVGGTAGQTAVEAVRNALGAIKGRGPATTEGGGDEEPLPEEEQP